MITSKQVIAASAKPLILTILNLGESYEYNIIQKVTEENVVLWPAPQILQSHGKWQKRAGSRKVTVGQRPQYLCPLMGSATHSFIKSNN